MRGVILAMALAATPVLAQAAPNLSLARQVADLSSGAGFEHVSLKIATAYARGYVAGAVQAGETVDLAAMQKAIADQAAINARETREAVTRIFAGLFTSRELEAVRNYYAAPAGQRGAIPGFLGFKSEALSQARETQIEALRGGLMRAILAEYCEQTACSARTKQAALQVTPAALK